MKKILCFILLAGAVSSPFGSVAQTLPPFELQTQEETETVEVKLPESAPKYTFGKVRFALDVGLSVRLGKTVEGAMGDLTSEETTEFLEQMRYGFTYGASLTGFFNTRFGMGAKFVGNNYSADSHGYTANVNTFYIAPEFVIRLPVGSHRNALIFSASMGYVHFIQKLNYGVLKAPTISKGGLKAVVEASIDFRIAKNVFFGPKVAITAGVVSAEIDGETIEESLNAIEIGGGFRF